MSARRGFRLLAILLVFTLLPLAWPAPEGARQPTIRGHGPRHRSSSPGRVVRYYYAPYYSGWGYYGGYYPYYNPYHAPYAYGYGAPYYVEGGDVAFIDTDVSPERASVYLDGEYVGVADNFDGFPRFLSVEPGRHTIRFEAPGRQSVTRKVRVPRGAIVNFDFTLRKGADDESEEEIVIPDPPGARDRSDGLSEGDTGIREETGRLRIERDDDESPGLLRLRITPPDGSVYIDGEFMGTASTLSRLHGSLRLPSGRHTIEVARPGYRSQSREVRLQPGDPVTVEIDLERD